MQLVKKDINTINVRGKTYMETTKEEDIIVPDVKPDIESVILTEGQVLMDEIVPMVDKVRIKGTINYQVLYATSSKAMPLATLDGAIPFEEIVNVGDTLPDYQVTANIIIDDISTKIINSRKFSVRTLLGIWVQTWENDIVSGAYDIENASKVMSQSKKVLCTENVINQNDVVRIHESISIPDNKPNVNQLVWNSISVNNLDIKPVEGMLSIKGEMEVFIMYQGEEESMPIQYMVVSVPFSRELECVGCYDSMISDIEATMGKADLSVRPDSDGEQRELQVEVDILLDIKLYEDKEIDILEDLYSPEYVLDLTQKEFSCNRLLLKNCAKYRVNERVHLDSDKDKILQICNINGNVKVEETNILEDGVLVEGIVAVNMLYISNDDMHPVCANRFDIPFTYKIEANNISQEDVIHIKPRLEQISGIMIDSEEVEIKAVISLDFIAFSGKKENIITDIKVSEVDYEKLSRMPGIAGYIVKEGDTLWKLAKKYYTTAESIKTVNKLVSDVLVPGSKLIVVKG